MKKRKVTLDQMLVGTKLESDVEISASEVKQIRALMVSAGAAEEGTELVLTVTRKGSMQLSLRRHKMSKDVYFLNLSGNPLTFLTGDNTYGYAEADKLVVLAYMKCIKELEARGKFPPGVRRAIQNLEININSLEFATYTTPVVNKARMLRAWYHVYQTAYSSTEGETWETLLDLLDLKLWRVHREHKSSVCLKIMSRDGRETEGMLQVYDKALEIKARGLKADAHIADRLRLDLSLNYGWFRRRQVNGHHLKTMKDLVAYIDKRFSGSWLIFLAAQFKWALARTALFYMWEFEAEPVLAGRAVGDLPYPVLVAMLVARSTMAVRDEDRVALLMENPQKMLARITTDHQPVVIGLDMGTV